MTSFVQIIFENNSIYHFSAGRTSLAGLFLCLIVTVSHSAEDEKVRPEFYVDLALDILRVQPFVAQDSDRAVCLETNLCATLRHQPRSSILTPERKEAVPHEGSHRCWRQ
jgi:hypothetical protein